MITTERVLAVAKAIEGPHSNKFVTKDRLEELRNVRWAQLSGQDQGVRMQEARAAIAQVMSGSDKAHGID